jgi:hypothetical protein
MILEDRTFDELQHETCLCHATVPVIFSQDVKTECAHQVSWDFMPGKKADVGANMSAAIIHDDYNDSFFAKL